MRRPSVVQALEVPGPVNTIQVNEREPARPDDLEVVALDRGTPPSLFHPPAVADLDGFAPAVPADPDELAGRVQLHLDRRMLAEQAGHGRHVQRDSGSCASGSVIATRLTRSSPNVRARRAS